MAGQLSRPSPSVYAPPDTAEGFLEAQRNYLLGRRAATFLKETEEQAYALCNESADLAGDALAMIRKLINAPSRPLRQVIAADGSINEVEMSEFDFVKKINEMIAVAIANVAAANKNRTFTGNGGANVMAAAMITSGRIQEIASRKERSVTTPRRIGIDALKEIPVIEV